MRPSLTNMRAQYGRTYMRSEYAWCIAWAKTTLGCKNMTEIEFGLSKEYPEVRKQEGIHKTCGKVEVSARVIVLANPNRINFYVGTPRSALKAFSAIFSVDCSHK